MKERKVHDIQISTQEIYVLLSTIATANDSDARQDKVDPMAVEVRNWIVNRLLMQLDHSHMEVTCDTCGTTSIKEVQA